MLDSLINLTIRLGHWGYLVIFLGAMLESAAFLGVLVPGESLVLVAGFIAAQGLLDLGDLILVVAIGATLGDSIGYELGRHLGRPWLLRYGHRVGVNPARLDQVDAFFARHGGKSVFLGRFVGFARALVPFIAGSSQMSYRLFLPFNALGRARPDFAEPILTLATFSFPSGHVAASTLFYGLLAAFMVTRIEAWRWRVLVPLLAFLIVALVALSRVALGVHYLSDVLAALAESIAWLTLCLTAIHTLRRRRGDNHHS